MGSTAPATDDEMEAPGSAASDAITAKPFGEKSPDVQSATSGSDVEKQNDVQIGTTVQLKRKLQSRHLQMIAIGM